MTSANLNNRRPKKEGKKKLSPRLASVCMVGKPLRDHALVTASALATPTDLLVL